MQRAEHPTVMVADYAEDTRRLLKYWLETVGCRVLEAANGQEAIELTRARCPDLILMSLRIPVRDGFETARCIRQDVGKRRVPIVAMSTYLTEAERAIALAAGCNTVISQPIDFESLNELLGSLLPDALRPPS